MHSIRLRGARTHHLKRVDLDLRPGELTVVTGVSGAGKSSLAFDTLYSEGQRRYVESLSAYARQFLERLDRPQIERVEGLPPAIAIRQVNPIKTARSTVATLTELAEYVKLLFAKVSTLHCGECGREVRKDSPQQIAEELVKAHADARALITFPAHIYHAIQNIGEGEAMLINMPTRPYDHANPDKYRLPIDTPLIPHSFPGAKGW